MDADDQDKRRTRGRGLASALVRVVAATAVGTLLFRAASYTANHEVSLDGAAAAGVRAAAGRTLMSDRDATEGVEIPMTIAATAKIVKDGPPNRPIVLVDLRDTFLPITTKIAAQACAGLYNRLEHDSNSEAEQTSDGTAPPCVNPQDKKELPQVYTILEGSVDEAWLRELGIGPSASHKHWWDPRKKGQPLVSGFDFVNHCLEDFPQWVKYRYHGPARRVVPNVMTVAAALNAVPLIEGDYAFDSIAQSSLKLAFDATTHPSFAGWSAVEATTYVYDTYGSQTSTMAKMNPGYDTSVKPSKENEYEPPLVKDMDVALIDFVFSRKLFSFYLYYGCIKWYYPSYHHDSYELVKRMSSDRAGGQWPKPIPVYGYDDSWNVMGGDLYEAETMCVGTHNSGQIATESVTNLSFLSRMLPDVKQGEIDIVPNFSEIRPVEILNSGNEEIDAENSQQLGLQSTERSLAAGNDDNGPKVVYDKNKTYVALVVGDGDNVAYIKSSRADWMRDRMNHCKKEAKHHDHGATPCFPLTWTISPHLAKVAPDLLRWYVKQITSGPYIFKEGDQALSTGRNENKVPMMDTFVLPPSGHLYAYPGMMPGDVQESFVDLTEQDALVLNTTGVVDWEWFTEWRTTKKNYYPKFAAGGVIRGIFTVNVPYLLPTGRFLPSEYFKIISPPLDSDENGKPVVMFRPREWRGTPDETPKSAIPIGASKDYLSATGMAQEFKNYPRGTVTYLYMTSDGGLNYHDIAQLAGDVTGSHVELVSTELATALALASHGLSESNSKR